MQLYLSCVYMILCLALHKSEEYDNAVKCYEKLVEDQDQNRNSIPNQQRAHDSQHFVNSNIKKEAAKDYGTFDFVIIGAGSSGCVIANRVSEVSNVSVLLLEAGKTEDNISDITIMSSILKLGDYDWGYKTIQQHSSCLAQENHQCSYPMGKGLGGSSIINSLKYARGNKKDYDYWAELGNEGWSYKDVLPYFKKSEHCMLSNEDLGYHGHGGYLNVEYHGAVDSITDDFFKANVELGREVLDYNGKNQLGVSLSQFNTKNGRRQSTARAFLTALVRKRTNLSILTESLALKVLFDEDCGKAVGVRFIYDGTIYDVKASKEVILSAGVINSAQLLLLSGIGPEDQMKQMQIPLIKKLPVGEILNDHPLFMGPSFTINYTTPSEFIQKKNKPYLRGKDIFAVTESNTAIGYVRLNNLNPQFPEKADFEWLFTSTIYNGSISIGNTSNMQNDEQKSKKFIESVTTANSMSFALYVLYPKSKGTVKLNSNNPFDSPRIDPQLLSDPDNYDVEIFYKAVIKIFELLNTVPFRKYAPKLNVIPGCEEFEHDLMSREYWYCVFRQLTVSGHHSMSTCKMGPADDIEAVVDNHGRVHGIKNLRIGDMSIAPTIVGGHTYAVAIMIGEKISDYIKQDNVLWM